MSGWAGVSHSAFAEMGLLKVTHVVNIDVDISTSNVFKIRDEFLRIACFP